MKLFICLDIFFWPLITFCGSLSVQNLLILYTYRNIANKSDRSWWYLVCNVFFLFVIIFHLHFSSFFLFFFVIFLSVRRTKLLSLLKWWHLLLQWHNGNNLLQAQYKGRLAFNSLQTRQTQNSLSGLRDSIEFYTRSPNWEKIYIELKKRKPVSFYVLL